MKLRVLATAAVAAWSKTAAATTATVLPGVLDHPAEASVNGSTPAAVSCANFPSSDGSNGPYYVFGSNSVDFRAYPAFKSGPGIFVECPGTASLQASVDQTNWKTLDTQHVTTQPVTLEAPCNAGTWWYRGFYVTDDHAFKGTVTPQKEFVCF